MGLGTACPSGLCKFLPSRRICYPPSMSVRVCDPMEQKGLQTPASTPSDLEIRWDESQRMTHPLYSVLCYLLSTKPSTDPLPCGTPPNLEGEFLISICTLFSVLCYLKKSLPQGTLLCRTIAHYLIFYIYI